MNTIAFQLQLDSLCKVRMNKPALLLTGNFFLIALTSKNYLLEEVSKKTIKEVIVGFSYESKIALRNPDPN